MQDRQIAPGQNSELRFPSADRRWQTMTQRGIFLIACLTHCSRAPIQATVALLPQAPPSGSRSRDALFHWGGWLSNATLVQPSIAG
jgi:hypothetical protein